MDYVQKAKDLFLQGYNCAQSVAMAFADAVNLPEDDLRALANPFGGGICRLRETCGAVSGMLMIIGLKHKELSKKEMYELGRKAISDFEAQCGSYICRNLIKGDAKDTSPVPSSRTEQYYAKRPCLELVAISAELTLKYIEEK